MQRSSAPPAHVLALLLCALGPVNARAQADSDAWQAPRWVGDMTFLSANALLGGLTAGLFQELRGGSFQEGFAKGAFGGAIAYGGRQVAARDFWGAGLVGRQISATGASIVRNVSERQPPFSRLLFVIGPVMLNVHRDSVLAVRPRIDANSTVWLFAAALDDRLVMDWGASLSAGAPVFHAPHHNLELEDRHVDGQVAAGVIALSRSAENREGHDVLGHERVHVLQYDFGREIWGGPLETWLAGKIPGGRTVVRFVEPGIALDWTMGSLTSLLDLKYGDRPWEIEAEFLENR